MLYSPAACETEAQERIGAISRQCCTSNSRYSGVVRLTMAPRLEELQVEEAPFIAFLKAAFAQKRKTLANNLRVQYDAAAIRAALKAGGLRADVRAEATSLEDMAAVFRALHQA